MIHFKLFVTFGLVAFVHCRTTLIRSRRQTSNSQPHWKVAHLAPARSKTLPRRPDSRSGPCTYCTLRTAALRGRVLSPPSPILTLELGLQFYLPGIVNRLRPLRVSVKMSPALPHLRGASNGLPKTFPRPCVVPAAKGRGLFLTGAKASHAIEGDKTLKPRSASLGQRRHNRPDMRRTKSYFRDNSAILPPQHT